MEQTNKIAIYGAGSFAGEVFLLLKKIDQYSSSNFLGFFDDQLEPGTEVRYGKVIGNTDLINNLTEPLAVIIAIGNGSSIQKIRSLISNPLISYPNIINPDTQFLDFDSFSVGNGNIIFGQSSISYDVKIGSFNVFNTVVCLGHHVKMASYNTLNPNVQVSGNVTIGELNMFGLNSAILPNKKLGNQNTVVPGAVITRNFSDNNFLAGNPAKNLKI